VSIPLRPAAGARGRRVAVIDIGSNSVRMVVFDLRQGMPLPVFNEKATCRLAEGLAATGRLAAANMRAALDCLGRFAELAAAMQLAKLFTLATAAVRDADNGAAFVTEVEGVLPGRVVVLDGDEEARLSALGVLSGLPDADGIAGDLGGGSLEVTEVGAGAVGRGTSLPLGPLRLGEATGGDLGKARKAIDRALDQLDWLGRSRGAGLYLVGGAWRALARVMMARSDYPLHIIHGYSLSRGDAEALAAYVVAAKPAALARLPDVPRQRVESLPLAALVLARLLAAIQPGEICFSVHGLREGYLFDRLLIDPAEHDALGAASGWWARQSGLGQEMVDLLMAWTAPLLAGGEIAPRLRRAACQLSNIGWHQHPEYRALQALDAILHAPTLPLRHIERAFLALTLWYRYGGRRGAPEAVEIARLLPPAMARAARVLGLTLRLAYKLSGGTPSLLRKASLQLEQGKVQLRAPLLLTGESVERDLAALLRAVDEPAR
jgi:exopolyphosphatase / guanosine-5'-triphosphate,3'-diphosphate pyrophosphatase